MVLTIRGEGGRGVVVVGAGAAGSACVRTLLAGDYPHRITQIATGNTSASANRTVSKHGVGADSPRVSTVQGRAIGWATDGCAVVLEDMREVRGDALVIATGAVARRPRIAGDSGAFFSASTADEVAGLIRAFPQPAGTRVTIVGAGFLGSALASHFVAAGANVSLVSQSELPLRHELGSGVAADLLRLHRPHTYVFAGATVVAADKTERGPHSMRLTLDTGQSLDADIVITATEPVANALWAGVRGAVRTDERMRVLGREGALSGVYAAGSVSRIHHSDGDVSAACWLDSAAQGAHAAKALLHDLGMQEDPGAFCSQEESVLLGGGVNGEVAGGPSRGHAFASELMAVW